MITYTPADLGPNVVAGVTHTNTDRLPPPGLTFSTSGGADDSLVRTSIHLLAATIGIDSDRLVMLRQIHGSEVHIVDEPVEGLAGDGLLTDVPDLVLGVRIADCCGILLHDTKRNVIGAVHSGWRGTQANIAGHAISLMIERWGSDMDDIFVYMSPCASGERYEVGDDVARFFPEHIRVSENGRYLFDNRAAIRAQFVGAGISAEHITVDGACTLVDERYHSHRRDREYAGRSLAFIGLRTAVNP
ncbi:MAG: peptidoglycan editing factor PgeF ['Candidatus Kapabacteria' thiocyanatum]|uniref:Purine nucleoside phosphorylase n=1 Tax=Candidatus Kapaibacterium thiocyanatum TaxID=1895771 RepID=A0A1M3L210_9BACT|nr:peptidoglycan editing factor PgeF ['Candidatus Kapabacteria' thiocyanatum]OJX59274.1 MAG: hypothetical protein BGO89_02320 ['Candidatus Kapabacteria' thiocyanatum]